MVVMFAGFFFAVACAADSYLHVTFLVLLFFLFSVSCYLTNRDEYIPREYCEKKSR